MLVAACAASPPPPAMPPTAPPSASSAPVATAAVAPALAPLPEHLGEWIDAYASALGREWGETRAFSGYLLVAREGVPVFGKAYGKANRATGALAGADTRFRIGSITKQFTAVAILQLAEKGLVRVEDPLSKYLPGLPFGDRITLHHCLSHTSGIANMTEDEALMKDHAKPHTREQVVAVFASKPLAFEPGAEFRYSNSNYFLLGMVVEKVTGLSYEDYLQRSVLGPAGMTRTSTVDAPDAPDTAAGYTDDDGTLAPAHAVDMSIPFAAGALRSTSNDLVRWDRALAGDALLTADSKRRMVTPVREHYGYGVATKTVAGREVEEHGGGIDGFSSDLARVPAEHLVVVALSNEDSFRPEAMVAAIVEMAVTGSKIDPPTETAVVPFDAATLARFPGSYAIDPASDEAYRGKLPGAVMAAIQTIAVTGEQGRLRFKPNGQGEVGVFLRADGALFTKGGGISLEPEQAKGVVASFVLKQGGLALRYVRAAGAVKKR